MKSRTKQLSLAGIFAGLGVLLLLLGALLQVLDLSAAAIASLLICVAVMELSPVFAPLIYLATGTLSLVLLPDKLAALVYLCLVGYYPIVKRLFERLPQLWAWIAKVTVCLISVTAVLGLSVWLLSLDLTFAGTRLEGVAPFALAALYLACGVVFVVYDMVLSRFAALWQTRLRRRFGIDRFFSDET